MNHPRWGSGRRRARPDQLSRHPQARSAPALELEDPACQTGGMMSPTRQNNGQINIRSTARIAKSITPVRRREHSASANSGFAGPRRLATQGALARGLLPDDIQLKPFFASVFRSGDQQTTRG